MDKIYQISELIDILLPVFINAPVYHAVLFGSYAKGAADEKSDVDIIIDSKGELCNINFFGLLENITAVLNKKVDMIELSEIEAGSDILTEIEKQGVTIYKRT